MPTVKLPMCDFRMMMMMKLNLLFWMLKVAFAIFSPPLYLPTWEKNVLLHRVTLAVFHLLFCESPAVSS